MTTIIIISRRTNICLHKSIVSVLCICVYVCMWCGCVTVPVYMCVCVCECVRVYVCTYDCMYASMCVSILCVCVHACYLQSATHLREACSDIMKSLTTPAYATLHRQNKKNRDTV